MEELRSLFLRMSLVDNRKFLVDSRDFYVDTRKFRVDSRNFYVDTRKLEAFGLARAFLSDVCPNPASIQTGPSFFN